jgi:glutamate synthase (ferredoxin)
MSGGVAWVLDEDGGFASRSNRDLVGMGPIDDPEEAERLRRLIARHAAATHSLRASAILKDWDAWLPKFVRVMPHDYKRVLESQARMRDKGLREDEAVLAAFEENARSLARADGN